MALKQLMSARISVYFFLNVVCLFVDRTTAPLFQIYKQNPYDGLLHIAVFFLRLLFVYYNLNKTGIFVRLETCTILFMMAHGYCRVYSML